MNKVVLMGRLTKEPILRYTQNKNYAVCDFFLAVDRKYSSEREKQVDFISVVTWGKTAEFCSKYFKKGQLVAITGRIQVKSWVDSNGLKHYSTEIIAEEAHFAERKKAI